MNHDDFYTIQKLFPSAVFERGWRYYQQDRVLGVSYNRLEKVWFAEVHGSKAYFVEIALEHNLQGDIETYCDCPAFATYGTCKHIVAVLLEMSERNLFETEEKPEVKTESFIEKVIANTRREPLAVIDKIPMHVQYILSLDDEHKLTIAMKTGVEHRYVVQNMRELLTNALQHRSHFFTKKFSYDPEQHYFLQQDLNIFELIYDMITTGNHFADRLAYN